MYKAQCDDRERRLVALATYRAERRKLKEYAKDMGISVRCAQHDQKEYVRRLTAMSNDAIDFERQRVFRELQDLKLDLVNPSISADKKVALALAIIDRETALLGLNAPSRSVTAHVDADPTGRFHRFIQSASGLSDEQLETVFRFAQQIEREPLALPAGPPALQLEGEAERE